MSVDSVRLPRLLSKTLDSSGNSLQEMGRLHPVSLSAELNIYPLSRATMVLAEEDLPVQMHDFVELYGQNGSLGIFRVTNISTTYKKQRQVQLSHALDVFSDALLPLDTVISGTVQQVLSQIVAGQTANIDGSPYWRLGTCEDQNAYSVDIRYTNAMQCLTDLNKNQPDYCFTFDFSRFPWTLNFVALDETVLTEFRLSRNVESCQVNLDDSDMCNKLYLSVDTTTTGTNGSTTVTTHETHEDMASQAVWGIIAKTAGIKTEAVPDKAAWVAQYFAQHAQPGLQISISGFEWNRLTGEPLDQMQLGRICRVALAEYHTVFNERIVALSFPDLLRAPERVNASLSSKKADTGGSFASLSSQASETAATASRTEKTVQNNQTITNNRLVAHDQHITEQGTILHEAGLEIDPHGVWAFAKEEGALGTMQGNLRVQSDAITAEVTRATEAEGTLGSRITETAEEIKAEVYAANSTVYSYIQQTASSITAKVEDTEAGLYSYVQQTASGFRQTIAATTNRTWVQDSDPRSQAGGEHTPKVGDIWIESTHQGSWDGAEGYDWEHDEGYDWSQIMGARIWTWQNDKWELASDKQQVISYTDLVNTAENLISQKIAGIVNDEGLLDVYLSKLEQTATAIRSEVYTATSETYSYIQQTTSSIVLSIDTHIQKTYIRDFVKNGQPEIVIGEDGIARDADGRQLRDGDVWINTADQDSWDKALNWTWNDDTNYNWSDLRDAEILRYDAATKSLVQVVNGRVFTDPLEMEIADDRIKANMRSIDVVNGKVEENAHQLSVTTTELRSNFNDRISNVNSDLQQTKNQLSSVYAETIRTSEWQNWYEGTGIYQNRERINAVAGKFKVDANGNVHVIDGSGLYLGENAASLAVYTSGNLTAGAIVEKVNGGNAKILANKLNVNTTDVAAWGAYTNNTLTGGILVEKLNDNSTTTKILGTRVNVRATDLATWGVYTDDTLTAGIIVDKVNGGNVTINASKINLSGYVTASQLQATNTEITNLKSGKTTATVIATSVLNCTTGQGQGTFTGIKTSGMEFANNQMQIRSLTMGSFISHSIMAVKGTGGLSLDHYHAISASANDNGQITITQGAAQNTPGTATFNMADTAWYKGQVSAIKNAVTLSSPGWVDGKNVVSNSANSKTYTVNLPAFQTGGGTVWSNHKTTVTFSTQSVQTPLKSVTVDATSEYTSGETAGKNAVTINKGSWSGGTISFTKSTGTASTKTVMLSKGSTSWSGYTASVPINDASGSSAIPTGYTVTVDAEAIYSAGYSKGFIDGGGGASYSEVKRARGDLTMYSNYRTMYDLGSDGKYHPVGPHYWLWSDDYSALTTLYQKN